MAYSFQTRNNNKKKMLTKYESITQKVLLFIELVLQNAKHFNMLYFHDT
jgi:hypothetical protein